MNASVFETISKGFRAARERITGRGELTEDIIDSALRDVRMSLLEADVEFHVAKRFLAGVREKALGEKVQLVADLDTGTTRVRPEDHFVRICHEELVALMSPVDTELATAPKGVTGVMMVGLQGSGKTTTAGKLARRLQKEGKKVLLVAADVYRPAAVRQLQVIGGQLDVPVFARDGDDPVEICAAATEAAAAEGCDFAIYDTAGRLTVDDALMVELESIKARVRPANVLLVIDAMIGQDAVATAKSFDERIDISGVVLTKLDGDARGGAALSIKAATGKPIKLIGMGETLEKLEDFRPEGLAGRILGMGDLVGLMQDFQEVVDETQAEQDAAKMLGGSFSMDDFLTQIKNIQQMGSMRDLMDKLPLGNLVGQDVPQEALDAAMDDRELVKIESMIQSMTLEERTRPDVFLHEQPTTSAPAHSRLGGRRRRPARKRPRSSTDMAELEPEAFVGGRVDRVARGSGREPDDVRGLVSRFLAMRDMFGMLGDLLGTGGGMLGRLPGIKQARQLGAMRKLARDPAALQGMFGGGAPPMPGLPGGAGMPGLPATPGASSSTGSSASSHKSKEKRKKQKQARRRNRRK
jgi:signal recognition particle subunit SRP54